MEGGEQGAYGSNYHYMALPCASADRTERVENKANMAPNYQYMALCGSAGEGYAVVVPVPCIYVELIENQPFLLK